MFSTETGSTIQTARQPQDHTLPGMAIALDAGAMRAKFCHYLSAEAFDILRCDITRIKHKSGRYCQVAYRLTVRERATGAQREMQLSARTFPRNRSLSRYQKALCQPLVASLFAEPVYHFPEIEMVLWVFPNDRKLEKLPQLMSLEFLEKNILSEVTRAHFGAAHDILRMQSRIVHYVPEQACTVRVDAEAANTKQHKKITLYGKCYESAAGGAQSYNNMLQLWESQLQKTGRFNMARPVGYHAASQTLWQEGLAGKTLMQVPLTGSTLLRHAPAMAANVAALHRMPLLLPSATNTQVLLHKLVEVREQVAKAWPQGRRLMNRAVGKLLTQSVHLPAAQPVLLHGDLHLKNFFLASDKIFLIDLDNLQHGPARHDIGSFAAALLYRGRLEGHAENKMARLVEAFVQAYQQQAAAPLSTFEIAWTTSAMLIAERVYRCLTRLKAGRLEILRTLIELAEQTLETAATKTNAGRIDQ